MYMKQNQWTSAGIYHEKNCKKCGIVMEYGLEWLWKIIEKKQLNRMNWIKIQFRKEKKASVPIEIGSRKNKNATI